MKKDSPSYRIKYLQCTQKGHSGQINNLVCLNKTCLDSPLICSFCKEQKHKTHTIQPLKHYLQHLSKQYKGTKSKINDQIQQLEIQKQYLLVKIKESVQAIAQKFMELQTKIIIKYESIKTQLLEKEFRRNNFQVFYRSMINENQGDPIFQIQNYLNVQTGQNFKNDNSIENFTKIATQQLKKISDNLTQKVKFESNHFVSQLPKVNNQLVALNQNSNFIIPTNIIQQGNIFIQKNLGIGKGLGCLNIKFNEFTGKIKIKIVSLKVGQKITFGVVDFSTFSSSNFIFDSNNNNFQWFDSEGISKNVNYNYIAKFLQGSNFDVLIKKNHCKISSKGNMCDIQLHKKNESVFFFNLEGNCKIEFSYTNFKE